MPPPSPSVPLPSPSPSALLPTPRSPLAAPSRRSPPVPPSLLPSKPIAASASTFPAVPPKAIGSPANTAPVRKPQSAEDKFQRTKIPAWARSAGLKAELRRQYFMEDCCNVTPEDVFAFPEEMDLSIVMGSYLRRNAPRGSSANWTDVVKEYKEGIRREIELSDDGIVAETDSSTSTDDSLLSTS